VSNVIELADRYAANNYHPLNIAISRGEGVYVWDTDGKRYMDMLSAYSALNHGHCHPRIVQALIDQAKKVTLTSRAFHNEQMGPFLQELCELAGYGRALLMNSGAEAVETAVKAARRWGYKKKGIATDKARIIVCDGNFHGRTTTVISFAYREGFGPFTPGFDLIHYGDAAALEKAITPDTAAFLVEPIQGEAGIIIPPPGYLKQVEAICKKNRVLFICDEIQTGFGRTGEAFAWQHDGARPDAIIVGKALGGGILPVSAFIADDEIMSVFNPGSHGSTFGANPLACAVGRMAIRVLMEEKLTERSKTLGSFLLEQLSTIRSEKVKDVRGRGLFVGIEIKKEHGAARPYCEKLADLGVLCKETHDQVIRLAPPLVVTEEILVEVVDKVRQVL
jgi:ornithine--oxo-acid transaminase